MPTSAREPLLEVSGLSAGYGKIVVLRDVALTVGAGEAVALLGPNGAGKTTLLRAVSGEQATHDEAKQQESERAHVSTSIARRASSRNDATPRRRLS